MSALCTVRLLVVALSMLLASAGVEAQTPPATPAVGYEEPAFYRKLVADALVEYEAGHFAESRALMLRAHAAFPNARTLRGLGMIAFELREYADSVQLLTQALASTVRPLEGDLRGETEALLARARSFVGHITLEIRPAHAIVLVDGVETPAAANQPLVLDVGEHSLEARADDYLLLRRTFDVKGGEDTRLTVALVPASASGPAGAPPSERRSWVRSPWLWVSVGVVVAGAATATALALTKGDRPHEPYYRGTSGEAPFTGPAQ